MEDHKDELILILAGYQNEMENFLQTNPGLRSRFPIHIDFPDYNQQELLHIAEQICDKRQYTLSLDTQILLLKLLLQQSNNNESFNCFIWFRCMLKNTIRYLIKQ